MRDCVRACVGVRVSGRGIYGAWRATVCVCVSRAVRNLCACRRCCDVNGRVVLAACAVACVRGVRGLCGWMCIGWCLCLSRRVSVPCGGCVRSRGMRGLCGGV